MCIEAVGRRMVWQHRLNVLWMKGISKVSQTSGTMAPIPEVHDVVDAIPVSQFSALTMYYVAETVTLAVASVLNMALFVMLQHYSGFHTHLTIIIKYLTGFYCLFCAHGVLRLINAAYEWQTVFQNEGFSILDCLETFPAYGYTVVCFLSLVIAVERGYATVKFQSYEYDSFPAIYSWACRLITIPVPFLLAEHLWSANSKGYMNCAAEDLPADRMRRSIYPLIALCFMLIIAASMQYCNKLSKMLQEEYVKNNYSSISCRFQSRENLHTCTFLFYIFVTTAVLLAAIAAVDMEYVLPRDGSLLDSMKKKELTHFLAQLVFFVFPLVIFSTNRRLWQKLQMMFTMIRKEHA